MKNIAALAIAAVLLSAPAIAGDDNDRNVLVTPPLTIGTQLECIAANVGKTPVSLLIELLDGNGAVFTSETCDLPPGAITAGGSQCAIVQGAPFAGCCRFTVTSGEKRDVTAAILSVDANLGIGAAPSGLAAQ